MGRVQSLTRVFMLAAVLVMVSSAPAPAPFLDPVSIGAVSLGTAGGLVIADAAGATLLSLPTWYLLSKALLTKGLLLSGGIAGAGAGANIGANANANAAAGAGFGSQYGQRY